MTQHSISAVRRVGAAAVLLGCAPAIAAAQQDLFAYRPVTAAPVVDSTQAHEGLDVQFLRFTSPRGGDVPALLVRPAASRTRLAGIVMGHGAPSTYERMLPRAAYLARHGAAVLVVASPYTRRDPAEPITFTPADSAELVQQVVDYRAALDLLAARADVDATRLGFVGGSHSAYVGALLVGAEPRLAAAALAMGDPGYVSHFRNADGSWSKYFPSDLPQAQVARWMQSLDVLDARAWLAQSRVRHLLLQSATKDEAVPQHAAEALHAAAPARAAHCWYDSGHRLQPQAFVDQLTHFAKPLGLTPPTAADQGGPYAAEATATR